MGKVAAGFIVFRRFSGFIEYLLLQASHGEHHWTPPKGHLEKGETELETAYRETREEAGFGESDLKIFQDEKFLLNYNVKGKPKAVHYWLAELTNKNANVQLSDEHQDFKWLPLKQACDLAGYDDMVRTLKQCDQIILEKYSMK